jgi:SAM-dependent methyltransferase
MHEAGAVGAGSPPVGGRAVTFEVPADAYGRFMGRFSEPLAEAFVDLVGIDPGVLALDVGCGPGALTSVLVERTAPANVAAVDPSATFVEVVRSRFPGVDVRAGTAETLPWPDEVFDSTLAQLVVHFMADPVTGLRQMARVTRPGGTVAANVWDFGGGGAPLSSFWSAARDLDPSVVDESELPGVREGDLARLFEASGMPGAESGSLEVSVGYATFEEWWEPFTLGVGPAGAHVGGLAPADVVRLREQCRELLPEPPFVVEARAWTTMWVKRSA